MKKFKFLGIAVCVLLFVFAAGCQNEPKEDPGPQEPQWTEEAPLGASGLEAKVYDGMIILKWNNVNPVSSNNPYSTIYKVVRRDPTTNIDRVLTATGYNNNYYIDMVGWNNQLIDDRDYEYTVVFTRTDQLITTAGAVSSAIKIWESKITAKARIPDRSEFTPTLDADQINVTQYTTMGGVNQIVVSFPNEPNYQYRVAYTYGADQEIVREFESFPTSNTTAVNWYDPVRTATFPTIGGTNSVSVKAWFNSTDQSYYSGNAKVTKTAEFAITPTLNNVTSFQAAWVTSGGVRLTWNNVTDATGYKIYRAPVSRYITSMVTTGNVTVSGDWTVIDAAQEQTSSGWVAFDPTTDNTGHYLYAIIAEGAGGAKSTPAYAGPNAYTITGYNLQASVPDNANAPRNVQLTWTANLNTEYALHYAEVQSINDPAINATLYDYRVVGSFQAINLAPTALPAVRPNQATVTRNFTGEDGKNYIFRLTATRNGVSETFMSNILNTNAFSKTVAFTIDATNDSPGNVRLEISDGINTFRRRDYTIMVYRRNVTPGSETAYQYVGQKIYNSYDADNSPFDSWFYNDSTVTVNADAASYQYYQYKIVVNGFANTGTGESGTVIVNQ